MSRRTAPAERDASAPPAVGALRAALRKAVPVAVVVVPLGAWLARWQGWPRTGDALALVVALGIIAAVLRTVGAVMAVQLAAGVAALVAGMLYAGVPAAFLPPITINLAVACVFAATLRNGPPLIERFARAAGSAITPEKARYTRTLTATWAGYLVLLAIAGIAIAWTHDERLGAWWSVADYGLVAAFFAAEFAWRRRHAAVTGSWWAHVRNARTGWRAPRG